MGLAAGLAHPMILSKSVARGGLVGAIRHHLLDGTSKGQDIAALVRSGARYFEPFEAALLTMGEESGKLEEMLTHLADFHSRQYRMILKVKKWLSYPLFVSLFAVVMLPIPLIVQGRVIAYWSATIAGLLCWFAFSGIAIGRLAQRYQQRQQFVRARFARTLALCIAAGLPLPRAVTLAADASGHPALAKHVRRFSERALASQPLTVTLANAPVMTPELQGALLVAERTGDYAGPVGRLADLYEDGF